MRGIIYNLSFLFEAFGAPTIVYRYRNPKLMPVVFMKKNG